MISINEISPPRRDHVSPCAARLGRTVARPPSKRAPARGAQAAPAASAPPTELPSANGRTSPTPRRRNTQRTAANQSLGKGLQILDYFRHHGQGRLSDLAAYAGLNASTALRLALALQAHG